MNIIRKEKNRDFENIFLICQKVAKRNLIKFRAVTREKFQFLPRARPLPLPCPRKGYFIVDPPPPPFSPDPRRKKIDNKAAGSIERAALFLIPRRSHVDALSLSSL